MPVAWPEGKEKLVGVSTGSGQTGRLRCRNPLSRNVVREAASITPTVHTAARVCRPRASRPAATSV
jgi:hypothetical protein